MIYYSIIIQLIIIHSIFIDVNNLLFIVQPFGNAYINGIIATIKGFGNKRF